MNNNNSGDLYKKFSENIPAVLACGHSAGDENLRALPATIACNPVE